MALMPLARRDSEVISTSPKHAGLKNLSADEVKSIAAYLATLK
jgi:hypothetical protein